jgi:hypothetical protein
MLANKVGYSPTGLGAFLARLEERDKGLTDRSGLFASHPETKARLDGLTKVIAADSLMAAATVAPRFRQNIPYKAVPVTQMASTGGAASTGPSSGGSTGSQSSGGKFGLSGLNPLAKDKTSNQTVSSAGSRGVNPDRDAKGGPDKTLVVVAVSAAELADFRKGIV